MFFRGLIETAATARLADVMKSVAARATDEPVALSGHDDANRILLLGGGLTSGWGVRTHGPGLVGALQRSRQPRLGQHVDVHTVSEFGVEIGSAVKMLRRAPREDVDAIVIAFGSSDALPYASSRVWRQEFERLLAELDARSGGGPSIAIVVAGIPPLDSLSASRRALTPLLAHHAEALNAITRQVVASNRRAVFAPLPAMAAYHLRPFGSPAACETWAEAIAAPLAAAMPRGVARVGDPLRRGDAVPAAGERVVGDDERVRDRLHFVVAALQESTGADFAAVNLRRSRRRARAPSNDGRSEDGAAAGSSREASGACGASQPPEGGAREWRTARARWQPARMTADEAVERIRHMCDVARGEAHEWDGEPVLFVRDVRRVLAEVPRRSPSA